MNVRLVMVAGLCALLAPAPARAQAPAAELIVLVRHAETTPDGTHDPALSGSALLRLDPLSEEVVWRTRDLVPNDIFLVLDHALITGYGFTAEDDSVFLLDRRSGDVLDAHPLDSAHSYMEVRGDTLHLVTRARIHRFLLR